jgi:hypothetical protein
MGDRDKLIGAWRLTAFEYRYADGRVTLPYGNSPLGSLIYDRSGRIALHLMHPHRRRFKADDQHKGTAKEVREAFEDFIAYFGAFEVDEAQKVVLHRIEGSLYPDLNGTTHKRFYTLDANGKRLTLQTAPFKDDDGSKWVGFVVWERVG